MENLALWIDVIKWLIGLFVAMIGVGITYIIKIRVIETRLVAQENLAGHLVRAGEEIKQQQNDFAIALAGVKTELVGLRENSTKILTKLEDYDKNILSFYRDFDINKKDKK